jgi:hypothetical protein
MQLTAEDLGSWSEEHGVNMGLSPEAMATRQAEGGSGPPGNLSEEERAAMQATRQAGGAGGGFGDMSDEERAAMRATAEAGGMTFVGRGAGAGGGQLALLAEPLIELLTERAGG